MGLVKTDKTIPVPREVLQSIVKEYCPNAVAIIFDEVGWDVYESEQDLQEGLKFFLHRPVGLVSVVDVSNDD